ncbi:MAG: hypothetical protein IJN57_05670 [Oscillospiraceae bacterium]|nr:hypothetical protein [Oscillospiraceae bacterium]
MDEEQALHFARNAAEKAMAGMKTEASVRMRLKDEVPTVLESTRKQNRRQLGFLPV